MHIKDIFDVAKHTKTLPNCYATCCIQLLCRLDHKYCSKCNRTHWSSQRLSDTETPREKNSRI